MFSKKFKFHTRGDAFHEKYQCGNQTKIVMFLFKKTNRVFVAIIVIVIFDKYTLVTINLDLFFNL